MNYEFPRIVHIQQVLDAIKGDEDLFYVVEKDGYTVVNYKLPCNKTFPAVTDNATAIRRELRGIKFDNVTGEIMSRPYHKFFNAGEREETLLNAIDISEAYNRLEKLDGSMVHPILIGGGQRWATKMGVTDTSMQVEIAIAEGRFKGAKDFSEFCFKNNLTCIFEWCSRKNRIVVDYPTDRLVLTSVRETFTGKYWPYSEIVWAGKAFDLEIVGRNGELLSSMTEYVTQIHEKEGELEEGEVLRFDTGHMVKVKRKDYVNLHRTKDKIQKERNFTAVLLSGSLDDLKPFMLADDLVKAEKYEERLVQNINDFCNNITSVVADLKENNTSRKDFALGAAQLDPIMKQIIFSLWDKGFPLDNIYEDLMKKLKDSCETDQKFERLRNTLLKECKW